MSNAEELNHDGEINSDPSENPSERNINEQVEVTEPVKAGNKSRRTKSHSKPTDVSTPQQLGHLTKLELLATNKELLLCGLFKCQVKSKNYDPVIAERYAERLVISKPPNITVIDDNGTLYIADGHHRVAAAALAGMTVISADVYKGSKADAMIIGAEMNQGLPTTPAERKALLEEFLGNPNFSSYSPAEIAAIVGMSKATVDSRIKDREKGDFLSIVNKTKRPKSAEEKLHDAAKSISKLFEKHGVDVLRTAWSSLPVHLREDITGFIDSGKDS